MSLITSAPLKLSSPPTTDPFEIIHCRTGGVPSARRRDTDQVVASSGFVMKVYVEDVDQHFARAKAEGAQIISEPEEGFWGGRIYRVLDHEGNRWEISQRGRDLAADRRQLPPGMTRGVPE